LAAGDRDLEGKAGERVVALAELRAGAHDRKVSAGATQEATRVGRRQVDEQRQPVAASEVEAGADAGPRGGPRAGRGEAATVERQGAAVERGPPAHDAELRGVASVGMDGEEVERYVRLLDQRRAGEAALEIEKRRGVREPEHGAREAHVQGAGRSGFDAQAADPSRLLPTGAL